MANAIGGVSNAQQTAEVSAAHQAAPTPKQKSANTGAPQDTVTISSAGKAASQAQPAGQGAKAGGDADHDGR